MLLEISKSIGQIVADDYRAAVTFKKYGIDFCCKGNRSIGEACQAKGIDPKKVYDELDQLCDQPNGSVDFNLWPLDLLAEYIEKVHHSYVRERTPTIQQFLAKVYQVHGKNHPELFEIYQQFIASSQDLAAHMKKEEMILFPFIKSLADAVGKGNIVSKPHFGTIENPISMMKEEHDIEGERFKMIATLANNYVIPDDACNTYRVVMKMLQDFESNLHHHIHLENNILFPKAIKLESQYCTQS
jgi:regulator of cell morphogenesis and NO signaling